ncbi:hypothetical protein LTR85_010822 [Meristemomyces frigidus]|nr:hypothetical protein LTR85_010822 [Meristemomyces frigidus]
MAIHNALRKRFPEDQVQVLNATSNAKSSTYDGIDVGAERITHEIEEETRQLSASGKHVRKLSMVGYSLGEHTDG